MSSEKAKKLPVYGYGLNVAGEAKKQPAHFLRGEINNPDTATGLTELISSLTIDN
jgi:hypothetical protein